MKQYSYTRAIPRQAGLPHPTQGNLCKKLKTRGTFDILRLYTRFLEKFSPAALISVQFSILTF
jgi:hypothetical protein